MSFKNQLDYNELFGVGVDVPYTLNKEQFTALNTKYYFKLDQSFKFALADVVLSTDGTDSNIISDSKYTLVKDIRYTETEKQGSEKVVYFRIIPTDSSILNIPIYIKGTSFGTYTSNNAMQDAVAGIEFPIDGEAIDTALGDELFLDGVASKGITSDGRIPVEYSEDYEPALINVDGSEVANPLVKFANRGVHGFFGEYENLVTDISTWGANGNIDFGVVGTWLEGKASSRGDYDYLFKSYTMSTSACMQITIMKGDSNSPGITITDINNVSYGILYNWDTGNIDSIGVMPENYSASLSDDGNVVILKIADSRLIAGWGKIRIYPDRELGIGNSYFTDIQFIDGISYPVPYVKGKHLPTYGKYNFDWAASDAWTIEGWLKPIETSTSSNRFYIGVRDSSDKNGFLLFQNVSGDFYCNIYGAVSASSGIIKYDIVSGEWVHFKIVLTETEVKVYCNSVLTATITLNIPVFEDIPKLLILSGDSEIYNESESANAYISDLVIKPYVDESTTHYDNGKPYYNPKASYGVNGNYKISQNGDMSVRSLTTHLDDAYTIVEQYTIGDQTVTKWSNGDMEIRGKELYPLVAVPTQTGALYRNGSFSAPLVFLEDFEDIPDGGGYLTLPTSPNTISVRTYATGISGVDFFLYATTALNLIDITISYNFKGKWK